MIFKQLFSPKHTHSDPIKRKAAVEAMKGDTTEQQAILKTIAFNDTDASVRYAALIVLNDTMLWWKASCEDKSPKIQRHGQQLMHNTVIAGGSDSVSYEDLQAVIRTDNSLVEKALSADVWQKNTDFMLELLKQNNKPSLTLQVLFATTNSELQYQLLQQIEDRETLEKCFKKITDSKNRELVETKLAAIESQKIALETAEKSIKLNLSKLLALTEQTSFEKLQIEQTRLTEAYDQSYAILEQANHPDLTVYGEKFEAITGRLTALKAKLLPAYELAQVEAAEKAKEEGILNDAQGVLVDVNSALSTGASSITLGELEIFQQKLHVSRDSVLDLKASTIRETMLNNIESRLQTLNKLPAFQQAIEEATSLLTEFKSLAIPSDICEMPDAAVPLREFKAHWKRLRQPYGDLWPADLNTQYQAVVKPWHQTLDDFQSRLKEQTDKIRGLLRAIDNMIRQGRYKTAMGLHEKLQRWWDKLPEHYRSKLTRHYDEVVAKVTDLKDLQSYIAAPRKPNLIDQVSVLVEKPLSVNEQSAALKKLRAEFNSLGKHDTEEDKALNEKFDALCEKAFEPCRAHYQAKEQQRAENYQQKLACLDELDALTQSDMPLSELSKSLRQLQTQWRKIGHIDFALLDDVNARYQSLIKPLHEKVDAFFEANSDEKQLLIKQAEKLTSLETAEAVTRAKQLQGQWKAIGYAGQAKEESLWTAFRAAMDSVFNKQKEESDAHRAQVDEHISALEALIKTAEARVKNAANDADADEYMATLESESVIHLDALPEKLRSKFEGRIAKVDEINGKRRHAQEKQRVSDMYHHVLEALEAYQGEGIPESVDDLSSFWQQAFAVNTTSKRSRSELVLLMEIATERQSPAAYTEQRSALQIEVMAARLGDGEVLDVDALLCEWIGQGPVQADELSMVERIRECVNTKL